MDEEEANLLALLDDPTFPEHGRRNDVPSFVPSSRAQSSAIGSNSSGWTCAACTLDNKAVFKACEACGQAKPAGKPAAAVGGGRAAAATQGSSAAAGKGDERRNSAAAASIRPPAAAATHATASASFSSRHSGLSTRAVSMDTGVVVLGDGCTPQEERAAQVLYETIEEKVRRQRSAQGAGSLHSTCWRDPSFPPDDSSLGGGVELVMRFASSSCGTPARAVQVPILWRPLGQLADEHGLLGPGVTVDTVGALRSYASVPAAAPGGSSNYVTPAAAAAAPPPYTRPPTADALYLADQIYQGFRNEAIRARNSAVRAHNERIAVYNAAVRALRRGESLEPFVSTLAPEADLERLPTAVTGLPSGLEWCVRRDRFRAVDVVQGGLGVCWLVSAMSVVAERSHLIERLFVNTSAPVASGPSHGPGEGSTSHRRHAGYLPLLPSGVYQVRLCLQGSWRVVTVDSFIPVNGYTGKPAFTSCRRRQAWALLLEKAAAKACGSYAALQSGNVSEGLSMLTGAPTLSIHVRTGETTSEQHARYNEQERAGERGMGTDRCFTDADEATVDLTDDFNSERAGATAGPGNDEEEEEMHAVLKPLPLFPSWECVYGSVPGEASLTRLWLRLQSYFLAGYLTGCSVGHEPGGLWGRSVAVRATYSEPQEWIEAQKIHESELESLGLVLNHAYSLLQVYLCASTGARLVQLRNPWSHATGERQGQDDTDGEGDVVVIDEARPGTRRREGVYTGPWSDGCPRWNEARYRAARDHCGPYQQAASGVFWMAFEDFARHFHQVDVAKVRGFRPLSSSDGTSGGLSPESAWCTTRVLMPLSRALGALCPMLQLNPLATTDVEICATVVNEHWPGWSVVHAIGTSEAGDRRQLEGVGAGGGAGTAQTRLARPEASAAIYPRHSSAKLWSRAAENWLERDLAVPSQLLSLPSTLLGTSSRGSGAASGAGATASMVKSSLNERVPLEHSGVDLSLILVEDLLSHTNSAASAVHTIPGLGPGPRERSRNSYASPPPKQPPSSSVDSALPGMLSPGSFPALPRAVFASPSRGFGMTKASQPPPVSQAHHAYELTGMRVLAGRRRVRTRVVQMEAMLDAGPVKPGTAAADVTRLYYLMPLSLQHWLMPYMSLVAGERTGSTRVLLEIHSAQPVLIEPVSSSQPSALFPHGEAAWLSLDGEEGKSTTSLLTRALTARTVAYGAETALSSTKKDGPRLWTHQDGAGAFLCARNPHPVHAAEVKLDLTVDVQAASPSMLAHVSQRMPLLLDVSAGPGQGAVEELQGPGTEQAAAFLGACLGRHSSGSGCASGSHPLCIRGRAEPRRGHGRAWTLSAGTVDVLPPLSTALLQFCASSHLPLALPLAHTNGRGTGQHGKAVGELEDEEEEVESGGYNTSWSTGIAARWPIAR